MNERIRELAVQAGEEAVKSVPFFRTGRCQIPSWVNVFIEVRDKKFAELIIRECSLIPDWCIETGKDQFVETCMAERTSKMIKQHFGVE
jgi:hypothetical protein